MWKTFWTSKGRWPSQRWRFKRFGSFAIFRIPFSVTSSLGESWRFSMEERLLITSRSASSISIPFTFRHRSEGNPTKAAPEIPMKFSTSKDSRDFICPIFRIAASEGGVLDDFAFNVGFPPRFLGRYLFLTETETDCNPLSECDPLAGWDLLTSFKRRDLSFEILDKKVKTPPPVISHRPMSYSRSDFISTNSLAMSSETSTANMTRVWRCLKFFRTPISVMLMLLVVGTLSL